MRPKRCRAAISLCAVVVAALIRRKGQKVGKAGREVSDNAQSSGARFVLDDGSPARMLARASSAVFTVEM